MGRLKSTTVLLIIIAAFTITTLSIAASSGNGNEGIESLFSYISPRPGAVMVSAETTIALRPAGRSGAALIKDLAITVTGSKSGGHVGRVYLAEDEQTIIFEPDTHFLPDETVHVVFTSANGFQASGLPGSTAYSFHISPPRPRLDIRDYSYEEMRPSYSIAPTGTFTTGKYVTAPGDFPIFGVEAADSGIADGYIFMSYFNYFPGNPVVPYQLILDNNGQPVFYGRDVAAFDFKVQPNGNITYFDSTQGIRKYFEMNDQYEIVNSYEAGNGYATDNHDLQLLDNGNWLILSDDGRFVDMSQIVVGGDPNAVVVGCVIQEIDSAGNVLFEWNSFDYIPITDSYADLTQSNIRYVHCNAIEQDVDGNLLMSSRHLQEITKINRQTGAVMWRLGGMQNDFTFTNDEGFYFQHDIRRLPNGNITMFDNRTNASPVFSRAVDYEIDEQNFTITRTREYRKTPDIYGPFMGNYSYLSNGNRLIGWGASSQPILTEVNDADEVLFELSSSYPNGTYRAFRFPWEGHPSWSPRLIARQEGPDIKLYFSWNGSTDVVEYYIYGNAGIEPVDLLAVVPREGFETSYEFTPVNNGLYSFQVQARGAGSTPLSYSNIYFVGGYSVYFPMTVKAGS